MYTLHRHVHSIQNVNFQTERRTQRQMGLVGLCSEGPSVGHLQFVRSYYAAQRDMSRFTAVAYNCIWKQTPRCSIRRALWINIFSKYCISESWQNNCQLWAPSHTRRWECPLADCTILVATHKKWSYLHFSSPNLLCDKWDLRSFAASAERQQSSTSIHAWSRATSTWTEARALRNLFCAVQTVQW